MSQNKTISYTLNGLIEWAFLHLTEVKEEIHLGDGKIIYAQKYYGQARELIYRLQIHKPTPHFTINLADLTPEFIREFNSLSKRELDYALKEIASKFFENTDYEFFHLGAKKFLQVRLVP